jgi:hypothetical protein
VTVLDPPEPPYQEDKSTAIVVGVVADSFEQAIGIELSQVAVTASVDGATVVDQTVSVTALPLEVHLQAPAGKPDARIDVRVRGLASFPSGNPDAGASADVVLTRTASTGFVRGETRLLRLSLDTRCATNAPPTFGGLPPQLGPTCDPPTTCALGRCIPDDVAAIKLEPYASDWAAHPPDACLGPVGATPSLAVGSGETSFGPFADPLALVPGPQGGYLIWIALQSQNVGQVGTITKVTAGLADGGTSIPGLELHTTLVPDDDGTCSFPGIRYEVANYAPLLCPLRGQVLDFAIDVVEASGRTTHATASARVPDVLPPMFGHDPCASH